MAHLSSFEAFESEIKLLVFFCDYSPEDWVSCNKAHMSHGIGKTVSWVPV